MKSGDVSSRQEERSPRQLAQSTSMSLVHRLSLREDPAWRDFLRLYAPLIVCWCRRKGIARSDIADLAQDVYREVIRSIAHFHKHEGTGSFRGWLCRIVHRQIADFYQRRYGWPAAGGSTALRHLQQLEGPVAPEEDETQALKETSYLYGQAMSVIRGEFNDQTWQVFWELAVDERTAPEVAAEHHMTAAAVRQVKSRVLRRLKQVVGDVAE